MPAGPAQQAGGTLIAPQCGGVGKEDILLLVRTALHWSHAGADAAKPTDTAFAPVQLGRVTTSTQLRWDVGRNQVHITPGMLEEALADPKVKLTPEDNELLSNIRPDLEILTHVTTDGPPWTVVDRNATV